MFFRGLLDVNVPCRRLLFMTNLGTQALGGYVEECLRMGKGLKIPSLGTFSSVRLLSIELEFYIQISYEFQTSITSRKRLSNCFFHLVV
jgi:hypothetical protein